MLTERGTAGNWPARSNAKNSSKQGITSLSSIPNVSKLNSVVDNYVNPSSQVLGKLGQIGPLRIDKPQTVETELPSQETIKPINSRAETFLGSRKLSSNSPKSNDKVFLERHSIKYKSNHSQLKKPGFTNNHSTKETVKPDSDSDIIKWILYVVGLGFLVFLGGYGLILAIFSIGWGETILVSLGIFLLSIIPGLFYLWASHLYDGLKDRSKLFRIGFWGTVTILPIIFGLPIWIFAAIRDALKDSDTHPVIRAISKFFAWFFLIVGLFIAFLTVLFFIAFA